MYCMICHYCQTKMEQVSMHCALCEKARVMSQQNTSPIIFRDSGRKHGLASLLEVVCRECGKKFIFNSSKRLETLCGNRYDINVRAVWGSMVTGGGHSRLNEFLSTCNSRGMSSHCFTSLEHDIGKW
jgi:hypothetical protein